jgi:hypothetical protein
VVDLLFEEEEVIEVVVFFGLPHWAEDVSDRCGYISQGSRSTYDTYDEATFGRPPGLLACFFCFCLLSSSSSWASRLSWSIVRGGGGG